MPLPTEGRFHKKGRGQGKGSVPENTIFALTLGVRQRQFLEMARKLRVQYPDAIYHVMSRGNRRERIFVDDQDRRKFLQTLSEVCQKTGWQVHAYCLMSNHFHAVVETPGPNLVDGMKWFLGTYTSRFKRRHRFGGALV